jgi:hypothetical protein
LGQSHNPIPSRAFSPNGQTTHHNPFFFDLLCVCHSRKLTMFSSATAARRTGHIPPAPPLPAPTDTPPEEQTDLQETDALAKLGQHIPANPQGRLAKALYAAFHAKSKTAVQATLLEDIAYLNSLASRDLQGGSAHDLEKHVVQSMLARVHQMPPDVQVETLIAILHTIEDTRKDHTGTKSAALNTSDLVNLLATAAVKMRPDNPRQMVALQILTDEVFLRKMGMHFTESPFDFGQPKVIFDFAQRAIESGKAEALVCVDYLAYASKAYVGEMERSSRQTGRNYGAAGLELQCLTQERCTQLASLIGSQAARNAGAKQAPTKAQVGKIAPFILGAYAVTALKEVPKEDQFSVLLQALPLFNQSFLTHTEACGLSIKVSGVEIPVAEFLREAFFSVTFEKSSPSLSRAVRDEKSRKEIQYIGLLDPSVFPNQYIGQIGARKIPSEIIHLTGSTTSPITEVFPSNERMRRYAQVLQRMLDAASDAPSIGDSLYLMPGTGGIHEKYSLEGEYSDAHAQFQGIYGEMKTTLQANILHRLVVLGGRFMVSQQDGDAVAELFQNVDAVLGKEGAAVAHTRLLPVLWKMNPTHPKLPALIDAVDAKPQAGRGYEWRDEVKEVLTGVVLAGVQEGTTSFVAGLRLLASLDRKLRELHSSEAGCVFPVVSDLTAIHLRRGDIKVTTVTVTDKEINSTSAELISTVRSTAQRLQVAQAEEQERTVTVLLERCIPSTGQGRGKLSEVQADVVTQWLATKTKAGSVTPEEQGRVLRLFTEEALPAQKFMEMAGTLDWLSYGPALAQLAQLVTAAEKLEHTTARAMRDYKIPAALFFHMTQDLAEFVSCHPESASKEALKDRVQAMEDRHSLRLGGVPQVVAPAAP